MNYSDLSNLVRAWSLRSTTSAGSGHPTTCLSAADLMTVLFAKYFRYDLTNPDNVNNDRLVFSKGHAAPLLYTMFSLSGGLDPKHLLDLRKDGSDIEGHPTPLFKYSDAATGSLGQGASIGNGLAYFAKNNDLDYKTFVLTGDSELAEGQIWEACNFASYYKLNNLILIADINRLGQSQETMFGHHIDEYVGRFRSFGFEVIAIDGHNFDEIEKAYELALNSNSEKPYAIVAKTFKGKGVSFLEDKDGKHGKPLTEEELDKALKELGTLDEELRFELKKPSSIKLSQVTGFVEINTDFKKGDTVATRQVFGKVLSEVANSNKNIYSLDAEVKNSTFSMDFLAVHPDKFIECFIAEQNMVSVAVGLSRMKQKPFVSTFAAFFTRAYDQIRMGAIGEANVAFVGTHAGVSIGEDGSSQMGLEDIAMFATIPDAVIMQPSDAVSASKLIPQLYSHTGISYLRLLRPATKVIYDNSEEFKIGGSKTILTSEKDVLTIVASGITVHEALIASDSLSESGINVSIIDCYSIKPLDKNTILDLALKSKLKTVLVVEDHFDHGGLSDIVASELSTDGVKVERLTVNKIAHSGKMSDTLSNAHIDSASIIKTVKKLIK